MLAETTALRASLPPDECKALEEWENWLQNTRDVIANQRSLSGRVAIGAMRGIKAVAAGRTRASGRGTCAKLDAPVVVRAPHQCIGKRATSSETLHGNSL
jgi:hypothetical protein